MNGEHLEFRGGGRTLRVAGGLAVVGIIGLVIGALRAPEQTLAAYLTAYAYALTIALGALVFLMIIHAMRAGWPTLVRRLVEAMVATFPVLAVLILPVLFGMRTLYPWARLETLPESEREVVLAKIGYLNVPGFIGRSIVYLLVWIGVGYLLRRWSRAQDRDPTLPAKQRMYVLGAVLLPPVALALLFASVDWLMSRMPAWFSTMFPIYVFAGGFLGALALLTLLTAAADGTGLIPGIRPSHFYALGRLLLAFVIFWAYVAFFQLMLTWIANRPEETTFYLERVRGGWRTVTWVLAIVHFVLPFFALLPYAPKRRRGPMAVAAVWLLVAHYIDIHWLVMPTTRPAGFPVQPIDLAALFAVVGVTVVAGVLSLRGRLLVPRHDPALPEALGYESP